MLMWTVSPSEVYLDSHVFQTHVTIYSPFYKGILFDKKAKKYDFLK